MKSPLFYTVCIFFFQSLLFAQADPFVSAVANEEASLAEAALPKFQEFVKENNPLAFSALSAFELASWQEQSKEFTLFDLRHSEEYAFSHLPTAQHLGFNEFTVERVWMLRRNAPIVLYCISGEQSVHMSDYLKLMGFRDVRVLEGGLQAWLKEKKSLVGEQEGKQWLEILGEGKKKIHK